MPSPSNYFVHTLLRDLLHHIASGSAREMSVLVTCRSPLADLRDSQPRFFHPVPVGEIDVAAVQSGRGNSLIA